MRRILFPALLIALIAIGVTSRIDVDIDFDLGPQSADAIDLFGGGDDEKEETDGDAFWSTVTIERTQRRWPMWDAQPYKDALARGSSR